MNTMKPSEFASRIGVCLKTVQTWDNRGIFPARRTPTNRRYYTEEDVENYFKGGVENGSEGTALETNRDA
ncbi:MAG: helix-turn-helix domain-containing protein [Subdoligranulum variabile]|uniref:Helix-turn-helix domain-containing protein n=1 Tax=Subdoligranulum variabile TaxID=214851 RepID=A0A943DDR5_9FIRM|nr:helix-turn-helix domain-containing protein [Subdoligranulum variabile]DAT22701.1 MAG TPA: helix-turn-helix domain protein [Caudoviricetes sp.]